MHRKIDVLSCDHDILASWKCSHDSYGAYFIVWFAFLDEVGAIEADCIIESDCLDVRLIH